LVVSVTAALGESAVPVLLIHGTADQNIPLRHAHAIARANPERVELWTVPGAAHTGAWSAFPAEYETRVLRFLEGSKPR
jgi:uncharacterized protein